MCFIAYTKFTLVSCTVLTALVLTFGDLLLALTLYCGLFNTFDAGFRGFSSSSAFPDACKYTIVMYFSYICVCRNSLNR